LSWALITSVLPKELFPIVQKKAVVSVAIRGSWDEQDIDREKFHGDVTHRASGIGINGDRKAGA
jgi:hypothetical protein